MHNLEEIHATNSTSSIRSPPRNTFPWAAGNRAWDIMKGSISKSIPRRKECKIKTCKGGKKQFISSVKAFTRVKRGGV